MDGSGQRQRESESGEGGRKSETEKMKEEGGKRQRERQRRLWLKNWVFERIRRAEIEYIEYVSDKKVVGVLTQSHAC